MGVVMRQIQRPKGRAPRWAFCVYREAQVVFDSQWASVGFVARDSADWLAGLIARLDAHDAFAGCPGHPRVCARPAAPLLWQGDLADDCHAQAGELHCHAEWLTGPRRGGLWYASVWRTESANASVFHTLDRGLQPRSGSAARWLCELVVQARDDL